MPLRRTASLATRTLGPGRWPYPDRSGIRSTAFLKGCGYPVVGLTIEHDEDEMLGDWPHVPEDANVLQFPTIVDPEAS